MRPRVCKVRPWAFGTHFRCRPDRRCKPHSLDRIPPGDSRTAPRCMKAHVCRVRCWNTARPASRGMCRLHICKAKGTTARGCRCRLPARGTDPDCKAYSPDRWFPRRTTHPAVGRMLDRPWQPSATGRRWPHEECVGVWFGESGHAGTLNVRNLHRPRQFFPTEALRVSHRKPIEVAS
jgi:hypothetical protein